MGSRKGALTELQRVTLQAFAARVPDFFLTGGAVLTGWVLGHRATDDLDFFTDRDDAMAAAKPALLGVADALGATATGITMTPDFQRYVLSRGEESVRIDFVRDRTPQLREKVVRDGIRMDSTEEIFANKIAAVVGRCEIRDLVDLMALETLGLRVEDFVADARKKDGGVSPATLAWLLSSTHAPDEVDGAAPAELEAFIRGLEARMLALCTPGRHA